MKRLIPLLIALLLLLSGCTPADELLTEKRRINPIPEGTTAIVFTSAKDQTTRIVSDPEAIAALRDAYRWTNYHLYCCLEGEIAARMTTIVNGAQRAAEPDKVYTDLNIPSYNMAFRRLLLSIWEGAANQ